jgi:hypothetical protein
MRYLIYNSFIIGITIKIKPCQFSQTMKFLIYCQRWLFSPIFKQGNGIFINVKVKPNSNRS